jgi:hypothetical protein
MTSSKFWSRAKGRGGEGGCEEGQVCRRHLRLGAAAAHLRSQHSNAVVVLGAGQRRKEQKRAHNSEGWGEFEHVDELL